MGSRRAVALAKPSATSATSLCHRPLDATPSRAQSRLALSARLVERLAVCVYSRLVNVDTALGLCQSRDCDQVAADLLVGPGDLFYVLGIARRCWIIIDLIVEAVSGAGSEHVKSVST